MKMIQLLLASIVLLANAAAQAQFGPAAMGAGGGGHGLSLSGSTAKLFGENKAFSGSMELQAASPQGPVTIPGKIAFLEGKSRFEMDTTEVKGGAIPPGAAAQMKAMGMDKMIVISRPDKKISYMIYPGVQAYVEMPLQDADADKPDSDFKIEEKEIGKESSGGRDCMKSKVVVTDKDGGKHESTVWKAGDLNKFPVKIEQTEGDNVSTLTFKDVKLTKPETKQFDAPTDYKKCNDMMAVMQEAMKRTGAPK
jgi:hypothetical protein